MKTAFNPFHNEEIARGSIKCAAPFGGGERLSKIGMIVRFSSDGLDLAPLMESICRQTSAEINVILVGQRECSAKEVLDGFRDRIEETGGSLVFMLSQAVAIESLPDCDFFCFPSENSSLSPHFCFAMVDFLERAPEYGAVRCRGVLVDERDLDFVIARVPDGPLPFDDDLFLSMLSKETSINASSLMVRREAMDSVPNPFSVIVSRWDWQFSLPLAHQHKVGFIDMELFRLIHRAHGPMKAVLTRYDERCRFESEFASACLEVVEGLPAGEADKTKWRRIAQAVSIKTRIHTHKTFRLKGRFLEYRDELAALVEKCGGDPRCIRVNQDSSRSLNSLGIEETVGILSYHYADLMLQVLMGRFSAGFAQWVLCTGFGVFQAMASGRRLLMYGAGAAARDVLPNLLSVGLRPQCIWDRSAQLGQTLLGVPVTPPEAESISDQEKERTEVIVAIGSQTVAEESVRFLITLGFHRLVHLAEASGVRRFILNRFSELSAAYVGTSAAKGPDHAH